MHACMAWQYDVMTQGLHVCAGVAHVQAPDVCVSECGPRSPPYTLQPSAPLSHPHHASLHKSSSLAPAPPPTRNPTHPHKYAEPSDAQKARRSSPTNQSMPMQRGRVHEGGAVCN